jgi:transposase
MLRHDPTRISSAAPLDGILGAAQRIGIESSGSYGAGLLRFLQKAGIEVLEVTTPDRGIGKLFDKKASLAA